VSDRLASWRVRAEQYLSRADSVLGGSLTVVRSAIERFAAVRGSQAAASLSYYAFFSLFPLLLFILIAAGSLLGREKAYGQVIHVLGNVLPVGGEVVGSTIDRVLPRMGSLQVVAALGLLWAGTGFFSALVFNIDLGWPEVRAANPVRQRLYGLLMVAVLTLLLLLSLVSNLVLDVLLRLEILLPSTRELLQETLWPTATRFLPVGVAFFLLFGLYWGVPKAKVRWQAAAWGAIVAALAWHLVSWGFSWLLAMGLTRYEVIYGSLGAVVGLLSWMYLSSWIVLFGAHLTSAIDREVPRSSRGEIPRIERENCQEQGS
jgi:membrane protein